MFILTDSKRVAVLQNTRLYGIWVIEAGTKELWRDYERYYNHFSHTLATWELESRLLQYTLPCP